MGQGYSRNDSPNNIDDGKVVNASDFDGEFDAVQAAFNSTTGHTHDGTTAEGGPVSVLGPAQQWVASATAFYPKNDNSFDLGQASNEVRDLYIDRFAYIDGLVVQETATFNGATIADLGTVTTVNIDGGTIDGVVIGGSTVAEANFGDVYIRDSSPRLTFVDVDVASLQSAITVDNSGTIRIRADENDASANTKITFELDGVEVATVVPTDGYTGPAAITGGTISGITDLAIADGGTGASTAAQAVTNLGFTETAAAISGAIIPSGGIIMWSGSIASIPAGWALCDGTSGTPNLQNRFVVGAGDTYAVDATGGANTVTLSTSQIPSHTHGSGSLSTASDGAHNHSWSGTTSTRDLEGRLASGGGRGAFSNTENTGVFSQGYTADDLSSGTALTAYRYVDFNATHNHTVSGTTSTTGNHTHNISGSTSSTGSGGSHENRPPYYALAYIMKL